MTPCRKIALVVVACLTASVSQAAITNVSAVGIPNGMPGYVTTDLFISFDGPYYGSQLYLNGLTDGQVYQDTFGTNLAPSSVLFPTFPNSAFDTFLAQGGPTSEDQEGGIAISGGATSLGAPATPQFDSDGINVSWSPSPGTVIEDRTDFMVARITLSDQANGLISYLASAGGSVLPPIQTRIVNGSVCGFCEILYGDYDNSGQVSGGDLDLVLLNWGDATPPIPAGWVNDLPVGPIGQEELDGILLNWGNRPVSAVPEHSTTVLVFLAGIAGIGIRRNG